jgi:hypothetical protein
MRDDGKSSPAIRPPNSVNSRNIRRPSAPPLRLVLDFGTSRAARTEGYIVLRAARKG